MNVLPSLAKSITAQRPEVVHGGLQIETTASQCLEVACAVGPYRAVVVGVLYPVPEGFPGGFMSRMRIARNRVNKTNIVDGSSFAGGQVDYRLFE